MTKELKPYGVAGIQFNEAELAAGYTYTTRDGKLFSTPLVFPDNPHNDLVKNAHAILDIGCGVGRNLEWIMENTTAIYIGLDPNESMIKYFWDYNQKYKNYNRVFLCKNYEEVDAVLANMNNVPLSVVVSTFVFQHIGYRPPEGEMNVTDITTALTKHTNDDTVWILYEHDWEEEWIGRWINDTGLYPDVYIRDYAGIEELTHRLPHHLIIAKGVPDA